MKIRQFHFELTFNGLICKGNGISKEMDYFNAHYSALWGFMG